MNALVLRSAAVSPLKVREHVYRAAVQRTGWPGALLLSYPVGLDIVVAVLARRALHRAGMPASVNDLPRLIGQRVVRAPWRQELGRRRLTRRRWRRTARHLQSQRPRPHEIAD